MSATDICFEAGTENPQGAENSALKNTAPFSLTPLKISENASMSGGLSAKSTGIRAKESERASRSSKSKRRSGMVAGPKSPHNCSPDTNQCQSGDHQMNRKIMETKTSPKWSRQQSESSAMGKRRVHRDRGFHAAVRRGGCRVAWRYAAAARLGSRQRRWHDSTSASPSRRQCNGS